MNDFVIIPGLNNIAVKIFENLNENDLKSCLEVSEAWKSLIETQIFYWRHFIIRKIENLRKQHPKLMSDSEIQSEFNHHIKTYNKLAEKSMKNSTMAQKRKWLSIHVNYGALDTFEISKDWINFLCHLLGMVIYSI